MEKSELNKLLKLGEGLTIEFKESVSHLSREICAFANASGGTILVGVRDDGTIKGVNHLNRTKSEIQAIARNMEPPLALTIETLDRVMIVTVPNGRNKPYSANGKFYLREAANTQQMKRNELREFFFKEGLIRFDEQVAHDFDLKKDFSIKRYRDFAKRAEIPSGMKSEDVLRNLKVTTESGMTNAGALLFAKRVTHFSLQSPVICALFQGREKTKILDKKNFEGNLVENYHHALNYLKTHLNTEYIIKGGPREEVLEFPEVALREALLNAIAHRDYRSTGHVQVHLFNDRVEIINPGGLVGGLKPKQLGSVSMPRNPLIFALLHRMNLVEHIGSGIKRIRDELKNHDLEPPMIVSNEVYFSITFKRKSRQSIGDDDGDSIGESDRDNIGDGLTMNQYKMLQLLSKNPKLSARKLGELIGITPRNIEENIKKLHNKGLVSRVGSPKSGYWKVHDFSDGDKVGDSIGESDGDDLTENQRKLVTALLKNPKLSARQLADLVGISSRNIEANLSKLQSKKILIREGSPKGGAWVVKLKK